MVGKAYGLKSTKNYQDMRGWGANNKLHVGHLQNITREKSRAGGRPWPHAHPESSRAEYMDIDRGLVMKIWGRLLSAEPFLLLPLLELSSLSVTAEFWSYADMSCLPATK